MRQPLTTASVKVMRSFDYCHFEISLGIADDNISIDEVNELRKRAARLADKAVEQYKRMKASIETHDREVRKHEWDAGRIAAISETAEHDRTPEEQAALKAWNDFRFSQQYDYEE